MPHYVYSPREFSFSQIFTTKHKLLVSDNKQMLKCKNCWNITATKTAKHIQQNIF